VKDYLKKRYYTLHFFYQYIGRKIYAVFGYSSLMVLMDSVGLALFIPLLQIADNSSTVNVEEVNMSVIDNVVHNFFNFLGIPISITWMLALIVFIFFIKGIFFYLANKYNALAQQTVSFKMRSRLANSIMNLNYKEFVKADVGRMQNSLIAEVSLVITGCMQYIEAIKNGLFVVLYLGVAFFIDWKFSILVIIGGALSNLIYKYFYVRTQKLSKNVTKINHRYGGVVVEIINHFKYLKATGRDQLFFQRLQNELNEMVNNYIHIAKLGAKLASIREPMTILVVCSVILIHVKVFNSPLSAVIIILFFFYRVMQKIIDIQNNWNAYLAQSGSIDNIMNYQKYLDQNREKFYHGFQKVETFDSLDLKDINVSYENNTVLNGISISIKKNDYIAFVGESGSGKTTLVNLLSSLLPFDKGDFLLNNKNISSYDIASYKSMIGYVSQEPTIFNGDIFDNITFWDERSTDNLARFNKAIDMCSLRNFVDQLDKGANTVLGNNGINISGGQKQRISIAREIYKNAQILILDEATSALDSETESFIQESIQQLRGKITIISIAHRLSTVKSADCLYLLDKGSIVGFGTFQELITSSNYFKKLAELQGL